MQDQPVNTVEHKRAAIRRLERRIADLEPFGGELECSEDEFCHIKATFKDALEESLLHAFGAESRRYQTHQGVIDDVNLLYNLHEPAIWLGYLPEDIRKLKDKVECIARKLRRSIRVLEEDIDDMQSVSGASTVRSSEVDSNKIFVVHGHDEGAREAVARYLEKLGFDPIILHEKANQGRAIIEKFEKNADVGFAVVLLTPDDVGSVKGGNLQPRARQNVFLELGYFIGKLGRENVCALKRGDIEIPSDLLGVVYVDFDAYRGWQQKLGQELKSAGYEIDWNKVMAD